MRPGITSTEFGSITIAGRVYEHDVLIRADGTIEKRKKKLSKEIYGTSHKISLAEAEQIYQHGMELLIIGSGQTGFVELSAEAADFFSKQGCKVKLLPTPEAILKWNEAKGKTSGLFHVTC